MGKENPASDPQRIRKRWTKLFDQLGLDDIYT